MQILKPDKSNISWLSNWLIVSFSSPEPCNPKIASQFLTNYLDNWKLRNFFGNCAGYGICFCLFSARVKGKILWKLVKLICGKVVSLKFAILFHQLHIVQPWSYLEQSWRQAILWSIHHYPAWFFSKMSFAIGLIAPGCWCYTHNGLFQKKTRGELRIYFFESPLEFLGFLLYPRKFQTKKGFTPRNSTKLCYTSQKF